MIFFLLHGILFEYVYLFIVGIGTDDTTNHVAIAEQSKEKWLQGPDEQ